jgi:hypothetical protein
MIAKKGGAPAEETEAPAQHEQAGSSEAQRGYTAQVLRFSLAEEAQLRRRIIEAFDLRETPYVRDACDAIVEWYWRTLPDRLERRAS